MRTGFRESVAAGYDYAITIDSDGQHYADDLPAFLNKLESNPAAIIIGARNMGQSTVPGKSSFGNKFSNFWFWVETGLTMQDTQSGYRLYPVRLMQNIRFITRKFEFEIEVLSPVIAGGVLVSSTFQSGYFIRRKENAFLIFGHLKILHESASLNTIFVTDCAFYIKPRDFIRSLKKKTLGSSLREQLFNPC